MQALKALLPLEKAWHAVALKTGLAADLETAKSFKGGTAKMFLQSGTTRLVLEKHHELRKNEDGAWSLLLIKGDFYPDRHVITGPDSDAVIDPDGFRIEEHESVANGLKLDDGIARLRNETDRLRRSSGDRWEFHEASGADSLKAAEQTLSYRLRHPAPSSPAP